MLFNKSWELLHRFEFDHVADEYAGNLSGGQKRLLELARALMASPKFLMLDEPMAGVNPSLADELGHRLKELNQEGMTILLCGGEWSPSMVWGMELASGCKVFRRSTTLMYAGA